MSFRLKTILGIAFIESILLLILIIGVKNFLLQSNEDQLLQRAKTTAHIFSSAIKDPVLSTDLATLDSFIEEILSSQDILYARISNSSHILSQGGDKSLLKRKFIADTKLESIDDNVFDTVSYITESGTVYGKIEFGLSTTNILSSLEKANNWSILIAILEVALVAIFSFLLGTYLTRQLLKLKDASDTIAEHGPGHLIKLSGNDELTDVAKAFNIMSLNMAQIYKDLNESLDMQHEMVKLSEQSQAKYKAILSSSLDGLITINSKGEVIDYNKVSESIFGWSLYELKNKPISDFIIPKELREAHIKGMLKYLSTGHSTLFNQRLELSALTKSGSTIPIEITITPVVTDQGEFFTAFIRDITQRLQSEQELKLAATAFDTAEAMFISNSDGTIIHSNTALTKILGYSTNEVIGQKPSIFSSGTHDTEFYHQMWDDLLSKGQWNGEIYNKRKNGDIFPELLNISAVKNNDNEITHFVAHLVDISEQKNNEAVLKIAQQESDKANTAKSNFLAAMSHEIRTPMNAVLGIFSLLRDTHLDNAQSKLVQTGRESGELLLTIINDILDFTKMEVDKLNLDAISFDLHRLLKNTVVLLQSLASRKGLNLILNIDASLPQYITGDPSRLRQILINLINNAIKFTDNGHITINAQYDDITDEEVTLHFDIIDTGIGIANKDKENLFNEFTMADQTLTRHHEGTGLGLAICKRLVTLMQGHISFTSKVDQGSIFSFTAKLSLATAGECQDYHDIELNLPTPGLRILLAEDNPSNQMVIKAMLESADLLIDTVSNGEEAVEAVQHVPYEIILMDISMPKMDGMTATKIIRNLAGDVSKIPIIALTAHSLSGDRERFLASGMNDYLTKPIDKNATLNCIAHFTNKNENKNENKLSNTQPINTSIFDSDELVNENVLKQLVLDTDAEIISELLTLYIQDAKQRVDKIKKSVVKDDIKLLEFETHTLGSSAAAHSNSKLCTAAREIEHLCQTEQFQLALSRVPDLLTLASLSFDALQNRLQKGFV